MAHPQTVTALNTDMRNVCIHSYHVLGKVDYIQDMASKTLRVELSLIGCRLILVNVYYFYH